MKIQYFENNDATQKVHFEAKYYIYIGTYLRNGI